MSNADSDRGPFSPFGFHIKRYGLIRDNRHAFNKKKAFPNQILSVTFTNKAAKEMQYRVSSILNSEAIGLSWLGTFHSISAKILRKHASAINLNANFTIIDQEAKPVNSGSGTHLGPRNKDQRLQS